MPIIKWVAPLTKLYPITNSLMGQREHPTFDILLKYRFCANI